MGDIRATYCACLGGVEELGDGDLDSVVLGDGGGGDGEVAVAVDGGDSSGEGEVGGYCAVGTFDVGLGFDVESCREKSSILGK